MTDTMTGRWTFFALVGVGDCVAQFVSEDHKTLTVKYFCRVLYDRDEQGRNVWGVVPLAPLAAGLCEDEIAIPLSAIQYRSPATWTLVEKAELIFRKVRPANAEEKAALKLIT